MWIEIKNLIFEWKNDCLNYFAFSDISNSDILLLSFSETVLKWMFILSVMSQYKSHVCKNGIQFKVLLANQIVEFLNQLYLYNKTMK